MSERIDNELSAKENMSGGDFLAVMLRRKWVVLLFTLVGVGAVCARCLGLYVGLGLGALIGRPRLATPRLELWLAGAALAMGADVATEALGWRAPWALLRFATGLALAYAAGVIVVAWLSGASAARSDSNEPAQKP